MLRKPSDQCENLSRSASGTPSMSQITHTGSGKPTFALRSAGWPSASIASISRSAMSSIAGRSAIIRLAVNQRAIIRRHC